MSEFEAKSLCILGRQPSLGLAELESLYGAEHVKPFGDAALLNVPTEDINFSRLGGTIKTAKLLNILPYSNWNRLTKYLKDNIPKHLKYVPDGKFTLGLSTYGLELSASDINRSALAIKKTIKAKGRPTRVVPNKTPALSSAQVLHNKLTHKGAWELMFVSHGSETILAQTLFVQDIEAYAARDQARPARDPKIGMLPPKLAQIIINLATSTIRGDAQRQIRLLDPFCGTGVILQEALLMGYNVIGTDVDQRMVEFAKTNTQWLVQKIPSILGHASIEIGDATTYSWPRFSTVASEIYLGPPLSKLPDEGSLKKIVEDISLTTEKFLKNLSPQLKGGQRLCLALPAWRKPEGLINLPVIAKLTDMGYHIKKLEHVKSDDLVYFREDQIVARQLIVLEKR